MINKLMTQKRVMGFKILSNSLNPNRIKTTNSRRNNKPKMIRMMQVLIKTHNNIVTIINLYKTKNLKIESSNQNIIKRIQDNLRKINMIENPEKQGTVLVKVNL